MLANNGPSAYICLASLEFRATAGGATQCAGGTPFAYSAYAGTSAADLYDGSAATMWSSSGAAGPQYQHAGYQFPAPVFVNQIAIQARPAGATDQDLTTWDAQWSDDGTAYNWAWSVADLTAWARGETRLYTRP